VITVALEKVLGMGLDALPALEQLGLAQVETNLTVSDLPPLLALSQETRLTNYKSVVLGPSKFATEGPNFINFMNVAQVRAAFQRIFSS
jgi:hypothetical protein